MPFQRALLPRSAPADSGVSSRAIAALLDRLEAESSELHSIMVVRHGHVVAEGWWAPYTAERPHLSLTEAWQLQPDDLVKGFLRVPFPDPEGTRHAEWLNGYGYQFWMSRHGYFGDGNNGQQCVVVPEHDLVIALTAATIDASAGNSPLPDGTTVSVSPADRGWLLRFGSSFTVEAGHGEWREGSPLGRPVVAAGGWQGDTFVADLYVITSPHRVRLVVDADAGTAVATWTTVPLTGPDLTLHLRSPLMTRPDVA